MENIFDAILFAVLVAAGGLGLSSWLMLFGIDKSAPAEVKQRSVFEYGFFGYDSSNLVLSASRTSKTVPGGHLVVGTQAGVIQRANWGMYQAKIIDLQSSGSSIGSLSLWQEDFGPGESAQYLALSGTEGLVLGSSGGQYGQIQLQHNDDVTHTILMDASGGEFKTKFASSNEGVWFDQLLLDGTNERIEVSGSFVFACRCINQMTFSGIYWDLI